MKLILNHTGAMHATQNCSHQTTSLSEIYLYGAFGVIERVLIRNLPFIIKSNLDSFYVASFFKIIQCMRVQMHLTVLLGYSGIAKLQRLEWRPLPE